jgi:hypothetical protein
MVEPDNLIHRKLNKILGWMEVRGKQLDRLEEEVKSIKGAVWALRSCTSDFRDASPFNPPN